jgi:serine/threonine-protein kinase RsbT
LRLVSSEDIVLVRQAVRQMAADLGFSLVDQTKLVTAASELARNAVIYGGGGTARIENVNARSRNGIRVTFEDNGPGIADVEQAMKDGFTTGGGLGLGLGGAKRLTDEFEIESHPGKGTRVGITRWR